MASLFILVFACAALAKFALSQWRAIWLTAANQPLSEALPQVTGVDEASLASQPFGSLVVLCNQHSPGLQKSSWLKELAVYYRLVSFAEKTLRFPALSNWAQREMQMCSRYLAVVLDQSLSMQLVRQTAAQTK